MPTRRVSAPSFVEHPTFGVGAVLGVREIDSGQVCDVAFGDGVRTILTEHLASTDKKPAIEPEELARVYSAHKKTQVIEPRPLNGQPEPSPVEKVDEEVLRPLSAALAGFAPA